LHLEPTACSIAIPSIFREAGIVSLVIEYHHHYHHNHHHVIRIYVVPVLWLDFALFKLAF
jgi:hypothetical protein